MTPLTGPPVLVEVSKLFSDWRNENPNATEAESKAFLDGMEVMQKYCHQAEKNFHGALTKI